MVEVIDALFARQKDEHKTQKPQTEAVAHVVIARHCYVSTVKNPVISYASGRHQEIASKSAEIWSYGKETEG